MQCQYKNCDKQSNWHIQMFENGENKFYNFSFLCLK